MNMNVWSEALGWCRAENTVTYFITAKRNSREYVLQTWLYHMLDITFVNKHIHRHDTVTLWTPDKSEVSVLHNNNNNKFENTQCMTLL